MKKVFSNHLFFKLGLLISTYAVSQTGMLLYSANSAKSDRNSDSLAVIWPLDTKTALQKILEQGDKVKLKDNSDINFDITPIGHDSRELSSIWDQDSAQDERSDDDLAAKKPYVFFSVDTPEEIPADIEETAYVPSAKSIPAPTPSEALKADNITEAPPSFSLWKPPQSMTQKPSVILNIWRKRPFQLQLQLQCQNRLKNND